MDNLTTLHEDVSEWAFQLPETPKLRTAANMPRNRDFTKWFTCGYKVDTY